MSNLEFNEPEGYWAVCFTVPAAVLDYVDIAFEDVSLSISTFEADPEGAEWNIEVLCTEEQADADITRRLDVMASLAKTSTPAYEQRYIAQRDWVSETQNAFPPIDAGRYFIHCSHYDEALPPGRITIQIDPGAAFGSGEHGTTSGCLLAIDDLASGEHNFPRILDMGCGSGILSIAMAKTWDAPIVASDIDPIAVDVTNENIKLNGVQERIAACAGDGYQAKLVGDKGPYDLIVCNILANPLIALAKDLETHLAQDGIAVLSGLLAKQEDAVLKAHAAQGLTLVKRFDVDGWHTLIVKRK